MYQSVTQSITFGGTHWNAFGIEKLYPSEELYRRITTQTFLENFYPDSCPIVFYLSFLSSSSAFSPICFDAPDLPPINII